MFVQSDKKNEWYCIIQKQYNHYNMDTNINLREKTIDFNRLNIDRGATIAEYNNFTYVLYYKYGNQQGHDIPILLNLNTGKSRRIHDSDNKKHNGAITDNKTAQIFKDKIYGMNIPKI
jgi:hypothetical protein